MKKFTLTLIMIMLAGFCFSQNVLFDVPLFNRGGSQLYTGVTPISGLLANDMQVLPGMSMLSPLAAEWNHSYSQRDSWKYRWVYMGFVSGGGGYTAYDKWKDRNVTDPLAVLGYYVDFSFLRFMGVEAMLSVGVDTASGTPAPVIPLMVKLGGKFGQIELTGNVGYAVAAGFAVGGTFGVHVGGPCILFLDLVAVPKARVISDDRESTIIVLFLGFKAGIGRKR